MRVGTPSLFAILKVGPLAYPPTPMTTSGLKDSIIFLAAVKLLSRRIGKEKFLIKELIENDRCIPTTSSPLIV